MSTKTEFIPAVKRKATTPSGVLRQAMNLLSEEGRWIAGAWSMGHEYIDPQKPLCSQGWGACADGALLIAIQGLPCGRDILDPSMCYVIDVDALHNPTKADKRLYETARAHLDLAAGQEFLALNPNRIYERIEYNPATRRSGPVSRPFDPATDGNIIDFNDQVTRDDVLRVFSKAYRHAQYVERKARQGVKVGA